MGSKRKRRQRRQRDQQPEGKNSAAPVMAMLMDSFTNPMARMGAGTPNLLEASGYVKTEITGDYNQLNILYRQNCFVQRLINTIPHDMLKNWYKIKSQMKPENLEALRRLERTTAVRRRILEGLQWGRLYGGAVGVMILDGHEDLLDQPLDYDMIMPDSFKGLIVFDRWSGVNPSSEIVSDIGSPDFGLPMCYIISSPAIGMGVRVHHSRVLRFTGTKLPPVDEVAEMYWGSSVVEHVLEAIKKYDNTSYNIAMLVFRACVRTYSIDDHESYSTDEQARKELFDFITAMNWMTSNQGISVIGSKDKMETQEYSFSGLAEVMELFLMDIAGAAEIPVTKLFGRSPAGMNATGESDLQNYYESIDEKQETQLRPIFDRLLPVMCMSVFGAIPDDLDYDFVSSRQPTEEERKNIGIQTANAVVAAYGAGIISLPTALKELRESSDATGMWNNISDQEIAQAERESGGDARLEKLMAAVMGGEADAGPALENAQSNPAGI